MKFGIFAVSFAISIGLAHEAAACEPVRVGYLDQERPPYWLGTGAEVPAKPGASAELVQRFAASTGCQADLKRLPVMRIKPALIAGEIAFAPMDSSAANTAGIVFPLDKNHQPDTARALALNIIVFVRSADRIPPTTDPSRYFQNRPLGITLGSSYKARMQGLGLKIDSGAVDIARNLEKLRLNRIDGFAVSVTSPNDMDAYIAQKYKGAIVRLPQPIFSDHIWLAASASYYAAHTAQVEKMWTWLGSAGVREFSVLLKEYAELPPPASR
ncbi:MULTISPECIES: hypothetical protein [unclassified Duganella]|uniref:hypothetical protein n=1 Tax=unclassified Duganella TaxID=2636909 RepID=UPI000E35769D|nr:MULTISPECIES: hypothetical protein [unclassified Duganella]RFP08893.1 hypothetical protein D0T23_27275 [Duganella sp. BJB475]RFP23997.1 hypothetical protein D0T21_29055 [Duganella sp. BJB476]